MSRITFLSITLVASAFALSVLATTFLFSAKTFAWAPVTEPTYTVNFEEKIDAVTAGTQWENWRERNYAAGVWATDNSSIMFVTGNYPNAVLVDCGTDCTVANNNFQCRWSSDLGYLYGCDTYTSGNMGPTWSQVYFWHVTEQYKTDYATDIENLPPEYGELIEGDGGGGVTDPDNNATPRCEPWDIGCWFSGVVGNVVDGFQSLADTITGAFQAMGEWIANLIMPANENGSFDNRFTTFFTDINDGLHERLGVLLFPFDFIGGIFSSMLTVYNQYGTDGGCAGGTGTPGWCTIAVPGLLGDNDVGFNVGGLEQRFPALWTVVTGIMRFVWVVGVVAFLHKKYFSVVKS